MKKKFALVLIAALAAGCQTKGPPVKAVPASAHALSVATLQKINSSAHACWMKDKAFKAYGLVPELDTTGAPRILVIPKGKPQALPQLVITAQGRGVQAFGPLAATPLSTRINADVARWASGSASCV